MSEEHSKQIFHVHFVGTEAILGSTGRDIFKNGEEVKAFLSMFGLEPQAHDELEITVRLASRRATLQLPAEEVEKLVSKYGVKP